MAGEVAHYVVTGLAASSTVTTKPTARGAYTQTDSFIFVNGTGARVDEHTNTIVLSGVTISAHGTAKLTVQGAAAGAGE